MIGGEGYQVTPGSERAQSGTRQGLGRRGADAVVCDERCGGVTADVPKGWIGWGRVVARDSVV